MTAMLELVLDGDAALMGEIVVDCPSAPKIVCLENGMESGAPAVVFVIRLPDGRVTFCQTSARALLVAAVGIASRFPIVADSLGPYQQQTSPKRTDP